MARYKFQCRSCKFECISGIGREVGPHSTKVPMVCKSCASIDAYIVAHPGSINAGMSKAPVCMSCQSSSHLSEWDGLTCPHCQMKMRALGGDLDAERPFKYW
jgi:hypothetical protein